MHLLTPKQGRFQKWILVIMSTVVWISMFVCFFPPPEALSVMAGPIETCEGLFLSLNHCLLTSVRAAAKCGYCLSEYQYALY